MEASEHDLLIRIDTRLERLERDFRDAQLGLVKDLAALNVRVQTIETSRVEFNPAILVPRYNKMLQEWNDFNVRRGVWASVVIFAAAAVANVLRLYVLPLLGVPR